MEKKHKKLHYDQSKCPKDKSRHVLASLHSMRHSTNYHSQELPPMSHLTIKKKGELFSSLHILLLALQKIKDNKRHLTIALGYGLK